MRTLRRLYLTVCCLGLLGMAVAWPRTYRQGDGLIVNGDHGRAFGIKTNPGEVFISSNRDKKNDPASLRLRTTKYFRCPPNGPTIFDRYIIYTHRALEGDPSGSALAIVLPSYPTVATRWAVPGIRAQGGTFNGYRLRANRRVVLVDHLRARDRPRDHRRPARRPRCTPTASPPSRPMPALRIRPPRLKRPLPRMRPPRPRQTAASRHRPRAHRHPRLTRRPRYPPTPKNKNISLDSTPKTHNSRP